MILFSGATFEPEGTHERSDGRTDQAMDGAAHVRFGAVGSRIK